MDIYPTLIELAGATLPKNQPMDGVSLVSLLRDPGVSLSRDTLFWHLPHYHHSTPASAIRRGDWKLIEFFEDGTLELYNLREDIGETKNVASENPAKVQELHALLKKWREEIKAPMPTPHTPEPAPESAKQQRRAKRAAQSEE